MSLFQATFVFSPNVILSRKCHIFVRFTLIFA